MTKARDVLTKDEIRAFTGASDVRGAWEVFFTWGVIAGALALAAHFPHPLVCAGVVVVLGGRQLGLAILMHECSHYSLFATRGLNEFVGRWLAGAPIWNQLDLYRIHHLKHHSHTGTGRDPDLGLVAPFPTNRTGLFRKFARDLTGIAGLRRVVGLLAMDSGLFTYSASTGQERVSPRPSLRVMAKNLLRNTGPTIVVHVGMATALYAAGHLWLMLLWGAAWLTTFGLFLRVRSIAEHACVEDTDDMLHNTRTTRANVIARALVAPHFVNYHLEHHLLMTVPCYRLPAMHRALMERGALATSPVEPGYGAVLARVVTPAT